MTRVESKTCIKCGSYNITQNDGRFVCKDCGLRFYLVEDRDGSLSQ